VERCKLQIHVKRGGVSIQVSFRGRNLALEGFLRGLETILEGFGTGRNHGVFHQAIH
jgi:hypothetical protein